MAIVYGDGSDSNSGRIVQVVSTIDTAAAVRTSGSNDTWYNLGNLSLSITPNDGNNKVLVIAHVSGYCNWDSGLRINRSGSVLAIGDASGSRQRATVEYPQANRSNEQGVHSFFYLDSPDTTSSRTYTIQSVWRGVNIYLNRSPVDENNTADCRTTSSLTLMEIAA
jgi:hypothetical protein